MGTALSRGGSDEIRVERGVGHVVLMLECNMFIKY